MLLIQGDFYCNHPIVGQFICISKIRRKEDGSNSGEKVQKYLSCIQFPKNVFAGTIVFFYVLQTIKSANERIQVRVLFSSQYFRFLRKSKGYLIKEPFLSILLSFQNPISAKQVNPPPPKKKLISI